MARMSTVTIHRVAGNVADEYDLDTIAGIAPRDVAPFVEHVGAELGAVLGVTAEAGRALIGYHVEGPVVRCRPVGTGSSLAAEAELRALAHEVAQHIKGEFQDVASERAA